MEEQSDAQASDHPFRARPRRARGRRRDRLRRAERERLPEPAATATPVPGTGTAAPDADDEAQDDAEDAAENKTEDAAEDDVTSKPAVLAEQAQKTALSQVSGGWIVSSELEAENGAPAWEISVADGSGAEREIVVDAASGKIIPTPAGEQENEAQDD
nr:hypothetical protein GCM10020093_070310 [Planobispora longispora]